LFVALLSGVTPGAAAPRGVDELALAWDAPASCPDEAYVERKVASLLGESAPAERRAIRARAEITHEEDGSWRVELATDVGESSGHRVIAAESCRAVADAVALVLALAMDAERRSLDLAAPASPPPPAALSIPAVAPSPGAPPEDERPRAPAATVAHDRALAPSRSVSAPPVAFATRTYVFGDVGTLPSPAPGVGAGVSAWPTSLAVLRFEVGGALTSIQSTSAAAAMGGRFWLRALDADVCLTPALGPWEVGTCAGAELDSLAASGVGEMAPRSEHGDWVSVRMRATGTYRLAPGWAIRADLGGGVGVDVPSFIALGTPPTVVYRPSTITGRSAIGLEARF
jgi:hypothetical protein